MSNDSDSTDPPTKRKRPSVKFAAVTQRVLVVGVDSPLRAQMLDLLRARGIRAEAIDGGIGAMHKIAEDGINTVVVMDATGAMSQESVIKLLRGNARTAELAIVAFVGDPRAEPPEGIDAALGRGTLSGFTDVVVAAWRKRAR